MNEQLIVKNFGPIKDATVDFKRVTVFIGPTGGGKSTLAKLAAIFRNDAFYKQTEADLDSKQTYQDYGLKSYFGKNSMLKCNSSTFDFLYSKGKHKLSFRGYGVAIEIDKDDIQALVGLEKFISEFPRQANTWFTDESYELISQLIKDAHEKPIVENKFYNRSFKKVDPPLPHYLTAERAFVASLEYSWAGLMRDDIGLPKILLDFANNFSISRKNISELPIPFLNVKYIHRKEQDFIKIPKHKSLFRLYETASGIQSVTPLLVLLEHLSRNTEQAQSFIIEEPELNLYPTAQQGLLNWLVEKCTKGENDLTITTHSPYILSSCNLLLEAYKVAQLRPDLKDEIAAIVPKACWLNPDDFAAYYVADGTVKPITDERTHLIGGNELDSVSGDISDSFHKLLRLKKQVA